MPKARAIARAFLYARKPCWDCIRRRLRKLLKNTAQILAVLGKSDLRAGVGQGKFCLTFGQLGQGKSGGCLVGHEAQFPDSLRLQSRNAVRGQKEHGVLRIRGDGQHTVRKLLPVGHILAVQVRYPEECLLRRGDVPVQARAGAHPGVCCRAAGAFAMGGFGAV